MQDCGFTRENKWFRYRAAAIIIEEDCVLFAGNEIDDYYYSIGGGVHVGEGIKKTIQWFFEHEDWMKNVTSGDYQKYYEEMYKNK